MFKKNEVHQFKAQVDGGMAKAESALETISDKLQGHDNSTNESASSFLSSAMEACKKALAELATVAEGLKQSSVGQSTMIVVQDALNKVQGTMQTLKAEAAAYDEKYHVSGSLSDTRTSIEGMVTSAKEQTTENMNAAIERANELNESVRTAAFERANSLNDRVRAMSTEASTGAMGLVDGVIKQMGEYDEKFQVTATVSEVAAKAGNKAKELDDYYGVSKKALELDEKAGGYGTKAVSKGNEMLNTGSIFVSEQMQQAKEVLSAGPSPTTESPVAEMASTAATEEGQTAASGAAAPAVIVVASD